MNTAQSLPQAFKSVIISLFSGFLFSIGLGVSGMTNPKNVIGFLDISRNWQPALIFVMIGAILVYSLAHFLTRKLTSPIAAPDWSELPKPGANLSVKVQFGNILFGMGWALAGYCPGPVFASLPAFHSSTWLFAAFMIAGFIFWDFFGSKIMRTS